MTEYNKRKYTHRKGQFTSYESGSIMDKIQKSEKLTARRMQRVIGTDKKKKSET